MAIFWIFFFQFKIFQFLSIEKKFKTISEQNKTPKRKETNDSQLLAWLIWYFFPSHYFVLLKWIPYSFFYSNFPSSCIISHEDDKFNRRIIIIIVSIHQVYAFMIAIFDDHFYLVIVNDKIDIPQNVYEKITTTTTKIFIITWCMYESYFLYLKNKL